MDDNARESMIDYLSKWVKTATVDGKFNLKTKTLSDFEASAGLVNNEILEIVREACKRAGVDIRDYDRYFPSPTSAGYLAPLFTLGSKRGPIEPVIEKGPEVVYTYLSYETDRTKAAVQYNFLDLLPDEKVQRMSNDVKENLTPYGIQAIQLVMRECSYNNRNPWFCMDTNRCLDAMGYKRDKRGLHLSKHKVRLYRELSALERIILTAEARRQKPGSKDIEVVLCFQGPILQITGLWGEWETKKGQPKEEGVKVADGIKILIDPGVYSYMEKGWYTFFSDAFLKIDSQRRGKAVQIYHYINNKFRVGLSSHKGILRESLLSILENSGALTGFPKTRWALQRDFIAKRLDDLEWLKGQKDLWIKDVEIKPEGRNQFDPMVVITMADDHPLKNMKMIKEETDEGSKEKAKKRTKGRRRNRNNMLPVN